MKTVILAGGVGSRLSEETRVRPKPMVEVGTDPILWHIMNIYAAANFNEFVVALGYKGEDIKRYFHTFFSLNSNLTVDLSTGQTEIHGGPEIDWKVHLMDTGPTTMTGGRIRRVREWVKDGTFMMTYGDAVANVDLKALLAFHRSHGKLATVTAVHPPSRFGELIFDGDQVESFSEKPQTGEGWINGGFFVLEPQVIDYIDGDDTSWEREPLERLVDEGQLMAYRHNDFWQPMDTLREKHYLHHLWESGEAPWKVW